jgi:hypothetical protein
MKVNLGFVIFNAKNAKRKAETQKGKTQNEKRKYSGLIRMK